LGVLSLTVLVAVLATTVRAIAELVGLRKALRSQTPGVAAIAPPVRKLLEREGEEAAGRVGPAQTLLRLKSLDVGEPAVFVALQPHTASARHLWDLIDRENHHLAIVADGRHQFADGGRDGARLVRRRDVEHLLALSGVCDALVLGDDESPALFAPDDELAAALVAEHGDDVGFLLELDKQPDRLAMPAPARQLRSIDGVTAPVGGKR